MIKDMNKRCISCRYLHVKESREKEPYSQSLLSTSLFKRLDRTTFRDSDPYVDDSARSLVASASHAATNVRRSEALAVGAVKWLMILYRSQKPASKKLLVRPLVSIYTCPSLLHRLLLYCINSFFTAQTVVSL